MENKPAIIPIYTSKGEAEAFLAYPFLYNRSGEWIGWITPKREVYSVLGYYVGSLTNDPRILRKRVTSSLKPRLDPPPPPPKVYPPATIPLAPMMSELTYSTMDVLLEEPELLHTLDVGEFKEDLD
ncbi:MAG: hypothetical protein FD146_1978 [Anaerolineaceae bacterium]|nr:MAG: hypothetical protein FD146_1978 [Anaerolineaceae bacterium]